MNRTATFGFFAAWLLLLGSAAVPASAAERRNPLWVVEQNGARIYLLGSVHVLPRKVSPSKPALVNALKESDRVFFETAQSSTPTESAHGAFFKKQGTYPKGDDLRRHLTKDARDLMDLVLPMFSLKWEDVQHYRPWLVALRLEQTLYASAGFAARQGVDDFYLELARKQKKQLGALETVGEQLDSFTGMTEAEQNSYLIQTIEGLIHVRPRLEALGELWRSGRTDVFDQIADEMAKSKVGRQVLRDRNLRWLPKIEQMIARGEKHLIVAGIGHLVGRDGLVRMLRTKGYSVRQL